jgi:hypothetical protein
MLKYILKFLWQLFIVGFPPEKPDCEHEWGMWENPTKISYAKYDFGEDIYLVQTRVCKKCGTFIQKETKLIV